MNPDVVCPAERPSFGDGCFDVVACRLAVRHFSDPGAAIAAIGEMARVSRRLVVIEDGPHNDERAEAAERLRGPTHVRACSRAEWLAMLFAAGPEIVDAAERPRRRVFAEWLACTCREGATAARVGGSVVHRTEPGGAARLDIKTIFKAVTGG